MKEPPVSANGQKPVAIRSASDSEASSHWYLVTVALTWEARRVAGQGRQDQREIVERILDLLFDHEDVVGARVNSATGFDEVSMYYRVDVQAEDSRQAGECAVRVARDLTLKLGGEAHVTDIQSMSAAELSEYQRSIRYLPRAAG